METIIITTDVGWMWHNVDVAIRLVMTKTVEQVRHKVSIAVDVEGVHVRYYLDGSMVDGMYCPH